MTPILSYTTRNTWCAALLLKVLVSCAANLLAGLRANDRLGYEGEVAGLGAVLLFLLILYLVPFVIWTLSAALRRSSKPVSGGVLLWALFPTSCLAFIPLTGWMSFRSKRVGSLQA